MPPWNGYLSSEFNLPSCFFSAPIPKLLFAVGRFHPRQLLHKLSCSELQLHNESSSNLSESSKLNRSHSSAFHSGWTTSCAWSAAAGCWFCWLFCCCCCDVIPVSICAKRMNFSPLMGQQYHLRNSYAPALALPLLLLFSFLVLVFCNSLTWFCLHANFFWAMSRLIFTLFFLIDSLIIYKAWGEMLCVANNFHDFFFVRAWSWHA